MVRYYGRYSNVTRERLKKEEDEPEFYIIEDDETPRDLTGPGQKFRTYKNIKRI
jgi:hypothetical protein